MPVNRENKLAVLKENLRRHKLNQKLLKCIEECERLNKKDPEIIYTPYFNGTFWIPLGQRVGKLISFPMDNYRFTKTALQ